MRTITCRLPQSSLSAYYPQTELQGYLKFSGLLSASTLSESPNKLSHCVASSSIKQENRVVPVWFQPTTKRNNQPEFIELKRGEGR